MLVLMSCPTPHQQEKCHQYWPAERSARYQYFVVDPMAEYNMPQYILREFKVTDARVSASAGSSVPLLPMPLPYPGQSREHATVPGEIGKQILPCTAGKKSCCPPPTAPLSKGSCPDSCVSPMSSSGIPVSTRSCLACAAHLVKHLTQSPCTWTMCVQDLCLTVNMILGWSWAPSTDPMDPVRAQRPAQLSYPGVNMGEQRQIPNTQQKICLGSSVACAPSQLAWFRGSESRSEHQLRVVRSGPH